MKIRSTKDSPKPQANQPVSQSQGGQGSGLESGLGQEFRAALANFAGGSAVDSSASLSFETFDVEALQIRDIPISAHQEPTTVQTSTEAAATLKTNTTETNFNRQQQRQQPQEQTEEKQETIVAAGEEAGIEKGSKTQSDGELTKDKEQVVAEHVKTEEVSKLEIFANGAIEQSVEEVAASVSSLATPALAEELPSTTATSGLEKFIAEKFKTAEPQVKHTAVASQEAVVVLPQAVKEVTDQLGTVVQKQVAQSLIPVEVKSDAPQQVAAQVTQPSIIPALQFAVANAALSTALKREHNLELPQNNNIKADNSINAITRFDGAKSTEARQAATQKANAIARLQPAKLLERVEVTLKEAARAKDGKTLSFRLDPPELGTLKVDVSMREGNLHARVVAESAAVAQMLREKAHDLQSTLRKLGLEVEKVTVSINTAGQESGQQLGNQANFGQSERQAAQQHPAATFGHLGNLDSALVTQEEKPVLDHWVA